MLAALRIFERASGQGCLFGAGKPVFETRIISINVTELVTHVEHLLLSSDLSDPLCVYVCVYVCLRTYVRTHARVYVAGGPC